MQRREAFKVREKEGSEQEKRGDCSGPGKPFLFCSLKESLKRM